MGFSPMELYPIVVLGLGFLIYILWAEHRRKTISSASSSGVKLPKRIAVQESRGGLSITYATPLLTRFLFLVMALICLLVIWSEIYSARYFDGERYGPLFFPLLGVLTYGFLVVALNVTTIQADGEHLTIRRGPLPVWGNRQVPVRELEQLYCLQVVRRSSRGRSRQRYALYAMARGREQLLFDFDAPTPAVYVEERLEHYLGIQDVPMPGGELRRRSSPDEVGTYPELEEDSGATSRWD